MRIKLINCFIAMLCSINIVIVHAKNVNLLITIPLPPSRIATDIRNFQQKIVDTAPSNGYQFSSAFVHHQDFHITLENIKDVEESLVKTYESCLESIASNVPTFDITKSLQAAHFEILSSNWGALLFTSPELSNIASNLRSCFSTLGLKTDRFPEFKAHISLGKFTKYRGAPQPQAGRAPWAPPFTPTHTGPVVITEIVLITTSTSELTETTVPGGPTFKRPSELARKNFRLRKPQSRPPLELNPNFLLTAATGNPAPYRTYPTPLVQLITGIKTSSLQDVQEAIRAGARVTEELLALARQRLETARSLEAIVQELRR